MKSGDSIAVDGICLTVARKTRYGFTVDVTPETIRRTHLRFSFPGWRVNLEPPLRMKDRIHGHLVLGHVDGIGIVKSTVWRRKISPTRLRPQPARVLQLFVPKRLVKYLSEKGSVAINGVSLTIARRYGRLLKISLIPETLRRTNLRYARPGIRVNIEVDVLARYVLGV